MIAPSLTSERAGRLVFELFDVAGRQLHRSEQDVSAGRAGVLEWSGGQSSGMLQYRITLVPQAGQPVMARGSLIVIR